MSKEGQIIKEITFLGPQELSKMPKEQLHCILANCMGPGDLLQMKGYYYNGKTSKIG